VPNDQPYPYLEQTIRGFPNGALSYYDVYVGALPSEVLPLTRSMSQALVGAVLYRWLNQSYHYLVIVWVSDTHEILIYKHVFGQKQMCLPSPERLNSNSILNPFQAHFHPPKQTVTMSDPLIPIMINLDGQSRINQVVLVDEEITTDFESLCTLLYEQFQPNIPEFYFESGERSITKLYVDWFTEGNPGYPRSTEINDTNMRAVLRLIAMRKGVDVVRVWLNEVD